MYFFNTNHFSVEFMIFASKNIFLEIKLGKSNTKNNEQYIVNRY